MSDDRSDPMWLDFQQAAARTATFKSWAHRWKASATQERMFVKAAVRLIRLGREIAEKRGESRAAALHELSQAFLADLGDRSREIAQLRLENARLRAEVETGYRTGLRLQAENARLTEEKTCRSR